MPSCDNCHASGECPDCDGEAFSDCPSCEGSGNCQDCGGDGVIAPTDEEVIAACVNKYCGRLSDGDVDYDDKPTVSRGDDGAYVQAWLYVRFSEVE